MKVECPVCHGVGGGYIRVNAEDWEWEPCPKCKDTGYLVIPPNIILGEE